MQSLFEIMSMKPRDEINHIIQQWGAPVLGSTATTPERIDFFMREPIAVRTIWQKMTPDERTILMQIVGPSARNWCAIDTLEERAKLSLAAIDRGLQGLIAYGIIHIEKAKLRGRELVGHRSSFNTFSTTSSQREDITVKLIAYVPTELATVTYIIGREFAGMPTNRTHSSLDDLLSHLRQGDLEQIGRRYHLTMQSYCSRNEVRMIIAANVCKTEAVAFALTFADEKVNKFYDYLYTKGGKATIEDVCAFFGKPLHEVIPIITWLESYAIAFDGFSDGKRYIFIPQETYTSLVETRAQIEIETGITIRATSPQMIVPADTITLWDIAALVSYVAQNPVELTRAFALPKRIAMRIKAIMNSQWTILTDESDYWSFYIGEILQETLDLGILAVIQHDDRLNLKLGENFQKWSNNDCYMQVLRILHRWEHNQIWQDDVGAHYAPWLDHYIHIGTAREMTLHYLRECDPGIWYDIDSFVRTLYNNDPFVVRPNHRNTGHGGFSIVDELRSHWFASDGEFIVGILRSTLHEFGILSLGYDCESLPQDPRLYNPVAFMLTELGAEVLKGKVSKGYDASDKSMIIQPNYEVLLLEPHMPSLYTLLRITQVEQLGRASRFKLTRDSILRAINDGFTVEEVVQFFQSHSQKEIAQNVMMTIYDWSRTYKEARLSQVVLIEVDSEDIALELLSSKKLRDLGLRKVGPKTLVAPEGKALSIIHKAIDKAGFLAHNAAFPLASTPDYPISSHEI